MLLKNTLFKRIASFQISWSYTRDGLYIVYIHTSVSLLWRISKNSKFFKLIKESGNVVNEFSYKASTRKFVNWPNSFGKHCSRFVYKYNSCKWVNF